LAALGGYVGASANAARPVAPKHPPALPRIVNPDGTLNLAVVTHIPLWEPPAYRGPDRFPAASSFVQNLSPSDIARMSAAQRGAARVGIAP
jgi:hypothetical protein